MGSLTSLVSFGFRFFSRLQRRGFSFHIHHLVELLFVVVVVLILQLDRVILQINLVFLQTLFGLKIESESISNLREGVSKA